VGDNPDSLSIKHSTSEAQKISDKGTKNSVKTQKKAVLHLTGLPYQAKSLKVLTENLSVNTITELVRDDLYQFCFIS
jgi:hypothetical protein